MNDREPQLASGVAAAEPRRAEPRHASVPSGRLTVGATTDPAEREADRIASALLHGPTVQPSPVESGSRIRRSSRGGATPAVPPDTAQRIRRSLGRGTPLPASIRRDFESRVDVPLDGVSLHARSELPAQVSAHAFTLGSDVFLAPGHEPGSSAGRATLAHEMGHVVQHRRGETDGTDLLRRKPISAGDVLKAVSQIDIVKQYLGTTPNRVNATDRSQLESVRATIKRVLASYEATLQSGADETTASAMKLAIALEQVAKVIALNELNDPALGPVLATRLFQHFEAELQRGVKKRKDAEGVLGLARALTAADPVARFMHEEISIDVAAREIRIQAGIGHRTPDEMFDLLSQKFEAEAASWTRAQAQAGTDTGEGGLYSVAESNSEVSAAYFQRLFGAGVAKGSMQPGVGRATAAFTPASARKLADLKARVSAAPDAGYTGPTATWQRFDPTGTTVTETNALTHLQSAHLAGATANDAVNYAGTDVRVAATLQTMFSISAAEAGQLIVEIKSGLAAQPMTLTVDAKSWFGAGSTPARGNIYQAASSRRQTTDVAHVLGRSSGPGDKIQHLGAFNDTTGQGRGTNYGRFRNWKDRKMALASNVQLADSDLPNFAALNANWNVHGSMTTPGRGDYGVNSYGDLHFHLRKAHLAGRVMYTAGDHGRPHSDPYLALVDFLLADSDDQSATGAKAPKDEIFAKQMILGITGGGRLATKVQKFEAQIFGEIDVTKDVEKISLAPSVTDPTLVGNVRTFAGVANAAFEHIADPGAIPYDLAGPTRTMVAKVRTALAAVLPPTLPAPVSGGPVPVGTSGASG